MTVALSPASQPPTIPFLPNGLQTRDLCEHINSPQTLRLTLILIRAPSRSGLSTRILVVLASAKHHVSPPGRTDICAAPHTVNHACERQKLASAW